MVLESKDGSSARGSAGSDNSGVSQESISVGGNLLLVG